MLGARVAGRLDPRQCESVRLALLFRRYQRAPRRRPGRRGWRSHKRTMKPVIRVLAACSVLAGAWPACAQDIEPRSYSNAPVGVNFAIAGYAYYTVASRSARSCRSAIRTSIRRASGVARRDVFHRRPHDARGRAQQRSPAELPTRRDARHSGRPAQLDQAPREQRRVVAHRQRLRPHRRRLAVPLGRRNLTSRSPRAARNVQRCRPPVVHCSSNRADSSTRRT